MTLGDVDLSTIDEPTRAFVQAAAMALSDVPGVELDKVIDNVVTFSFPNNFQLRERYSTINIHFFPKKLHVLVQDKSVAELGQREIEQMERTADREPLVVAGPDLYRHLPDDRLHQAFVHPTLSPRWISSCCVGLRTL